MSLSNSEALSSLESTLPTSALCFSFVFAVSDTHVLWKRLAPRERQSAQQAHLSTRSLSIMIPNEGSSSPEPKLPPSHAGLSFDILNTQLVPLNIPLFHPFVGLFRLVVVVVSPKLLHETTVTSRAASVTHVERTTCFCSHPHNAIPCSPADLADRLSPPNAPRSRPLHLNAPQPPWLRCAPSKIFSSHNHHSKHGNQFSPPFT